MIEKIYQVYEHKIHLILPEEVPIYELQAHVPGITLTLHNSLVEKMLVRQLPTTIMIKFIPQKVYDLVQKNNTYFLYGQWNEQIKGDIAHLLYSILRKTWIENGVYSIHSLCIEDSLLIGHSGAGKTSLALQAISQGLSISSYNKTLAHFNDENLHVVGGTQIISIRKELSAQYINNIKQKNHIVLDNGDRVLMHYGDIKYGHKINKLFLFFINQNDFTVKKLTLQSSLHELYPFFLDTVKIDTIIGNGQCVFDGNNTKDSKEKLISSMNKWLLSHKSVEILIGRNEDIINYIKSTIA